MIKINGLPIEEGYYSDEFIAAAGAIAIQMSDNIEPNLTEQEQAYFVAGFQECLKYLKIAHDPLSTAVDIKYLKIPNVCFSLTNNNDEREIEYTKQRKSRGFDDSETWSLTDTICRFIIPRLKRFKDINDAVPYPLTRDKWNDIIDKMLLAFELTTREDGSRIWNDEESKQIDKGLDLFRKWFMALWW